MRWAGIQVSLMSPPFPMRVETLARLPCIAGVQGTRNQAQNMVCPQKDAGWMGCMDKVGWDPSILNGISLLRVEILARFPCVVGVQETRIQAQNMTSPHNDARWMG